MGLGALAVGAGDDVHAAVFHRCGVEGGPGAEGLSLGARRENRRCPGARVFRGRCGKGARAGPCPDHGDLFADDVLDEGEKDGVIAHGREYKRIGGGEIHELADIGLTILGRDGLAGGDAFQFDVGEGGDAAGNQIG